MKLIKRILLLLCLLFLIVMMLFVIVGYRNYQRVTDRISVHEKIEKLQTNVDYISYDEIDADLLHATISIEDRRFYDHHGIDYLATTRALIGNVFAKGIIGGGSTITQQLAKNLYFTYQPSYIRKVSEVFVAYDLERELSKREILELYVNVINYGDNYIGIKQACKGYFNKESNELTLDEASLLAGLPQSPLNYQLSNHEKEARVRQRQVLEAMLRDKFINQSQFEQTVAK